MGVRALYINNEHSPHWDHEILKNWPLPSIFDFVLVLLWIDFVTVWISLRAGDFLKPLSNLDYSSSSPGGTDVFFLASSHKFIPLSPKKVPTGCVQCSLIGLK